MKIEKNNSPKKVTRMPRRIAFFPILPLFLASLFLALFLTSCGDSSKSTDPSSNSISGNWEMSLQKGNSTLAPKTQSGFLTQNGNAIAGSLLLTDTPCTAIGSVNGALSGSNVTLNFAPTGLTVSLTGTVGAGQSSMSGNYTILANGCSGSETAPQSGTWTANLVTPLSGNLQGTLNSSTRGASFPITGTISQGSNTGSSTASLTGTLAATGYCFTSINTVGTISGTGVALNLVDADGVEVGLVNATTSLDGTTITGTYQMLSLGAGSPPGCGEGDNGTVTLTVTPSS
jgi:hypothetical protein